MPKGHYVRKPKQLTPATTQKQLPIMADPVYMELVLPPSGLTLKVLDHPQHVAFTLYISKEGISHTPTNGKKASRMLTWHTIRQIAAMGLLAKE